MLARSLGELICSDLAARAGGSGSLQLLRQVQRVDGGLHAFLVRSSGNSGNCHISMVVCRFHVLPGPIIEKYIVTLAQ